MGLRNQLGFLHVNNDEFWDITRELPTLPKENWWRKTDMALAFRARQLTPELIQILVSIAREGDRNADRLKAVELLLDRGFGKAKQEVKINADAVQAPVVNIIFKGEAPGDIAIDVTPEKKTDA